MANLEYFLNEKGMNRKNIYIKNIQSLLIMNGKLKGRACQPCL